MAEFYIDNGKIFMPTTVGTVSSTADGAYLFLKDRGRLMFAQMGPSGVDYSFQPGMYANKIGYWTPPGNATTVPGIFGIAALTANGTSSTVTTRNVATTRLFTRIRRLGLVSQATAGAICGYRNTVAQFTMGSGTITGGGGFFYVVRFGVSDAATVAGARMFVGLRNITTTGVNLEPSTLTNVIGIGHGTADTNYKMYYGGSVAQTPIDLGANFPANTLSTDMYELCLFNSPSSTTAVTYRVERLNTGDVATGTMSGVAGTALPANTTLLTNNDYRSNNATALAVAIDYASIYFETDY